MARVMLQVNLDKIITAPWMEVKVLPFKVRSDSLSAHTEANHRSEAGNRAEPEPKQIGTLPLIGSSYGELNVNHLKKRLLDWRESG